MQAPLSDYLQNGVDDPLPEARQQVDHEVRRMKKAGSLEDYERREWLADLATRLTAAWTISTNRAQCVLAAAPPAPAVGRRRFS